MLRFAGCPTVPVVLPGGARVVAVEARHPLARLLGLALLRRPPAEGLLIPRCRSVHTWGMRFAIDVVFLAPGPDGPSVVAVRPAVPRRRVVSHPARPGLAVLELPAQSTTGATADGAGRTKTRWPTS